MCARALGVKVNYLIHVRHASVKMKYNFVRRIVPSLSPDCALNDGAFAARRDKLCAPLLGGHGLRPSKASAMFPLRRSEGIGGRCDEVEN